MKTYLVSVSQSIIRRATVEVKASSEKAAMNKAEKLANEDMMNVFDVDDEFERFEAYGAVVDLRGTRGVL